MQVSKPLTYFGLNLLNYMDLVSALSLSMWRLPMPHYVQWMNQSGTLKIILKPRVKFSIGNYMN
jgi:hypothetical protein